MGRNHDTPSLNVATWVLTRPIYILRSREPVAMWKLKQALSLSVRLKQPTIHGPGVVL